MAAHEIGHALGLGHEETNTAILNPYYGSRYSGLGTSFLFQDDINGVRAIYGAGTGSVTPLDFSDDNIAVRRGNAILMDTNFDGRHDRIQHYGHGNAEDRYLVGDWDGSIL